jgi:hypothetical protein
VNGHNRRCLSLRGNENLVEFDPLYRPATRGLHYGQELDSTNRPDTFEQTKPLATKILLAITRRTIQLPQPRRRLRVISNAKPRTDQPSPFSMLLESAKKCGHYPYKLLALLYTLILDGMFWCPKCVRIVSVPKLVSPRTCRAKSHSPHGHFMIEQNSKIATASGSSAHLVK